MTDDKSQLSFDFIEDTKPGPEPDSSGSAEEKASPPEIVEEKHKETIAEPAASTPSHKEVRQALAAWVLKLEPTGIGFKVPARFTKFQADIAAFWSSPVGRYLKPVRTAVVEIRRGREECWPECSNRNQLLPKLRELKEKREKLREDIRRDEPELRRDDNLFEEYVDWDYDLSNNRNYHRCMRQIRETEKALYNGSRFEMIRRTGVANLLYLAVPDGSVSPDEIADGWGLIYWNDNLEITLVRQADSITCMEKARLHLIQKIAESNMSDFMHANGLRKLPEGRFGLTTTPRKRKIRREIP